MSFGQHWKYVFSNCRKCVWLLSDCNDLGIRMGTRGASVLVRSIFVSTFVRAWNLMTVSSIASSGSLSVFRYRLILLNFAYQAKRSNILPVVWIFLLRSYMLLRSTIFLADEVSTVLRLRTEKVSLTISGTYCLCGLSSSVMIRPKPILAVRLEVIRWTRSITYISRISSLISVVAKLQYFVDVIPRATPWPLWSSTSWMGDGVNPCWSPKEESKRVGMPRTSWRLERIRSIFIQFTLPVHWGGGQMH